METIVINRSNNEFCVAAESALYFASYFISDVVYFCSSLSSLIYFYQNSNLWDERIILNRMKNDVPDWEKDLPPERLAEVKYAMKLLKKAKRKDKNMLLLQNNLGKIFNTLRDIVKIRYEEYFIKYNVLNWVSLIDQETVVAIEHTDYFPDRVKSEDTLIQTISEEFLEEECRDDFMMLFSHLSFNKRESKVIEHGPTIKNPELYSFRLFQLPNFPTLNIDHLKIIRNELLRKSKGFTSALTEFKAKMESELFGEKMKNLMLECYEQIKDETTMFQKSIDNQIYFMQALNAGSNYVKINIYLAVASIATVAEYFKLSGVLHPFVHETLIKNLSRKTDTNKSYVFLYLDAVGPPAYTD